MSYRFVFFFPALIFTQISSAQLFGEPQFISTEFDNPWATNLGDLDGDGDLDIIASSGDTTLFVWYENLGEGLFSSEYNIIDTLIGIRDVSIYDFDGDGDSDIAILTHYKIAYYENTGEGDFADIQIISNAIDYGEYILSADLDNDGDFDLLSSALGDEKIALYRNEGGGVFGSQEVIATLNDGPRSIDIADLDNDGDLDVIAPHFTHYTWGTDISEVVWYENQGEGIFASEQIITTLDVGHPFFTQSADLDGDFDMDIILMTTNFDGIENRQIQWCENLGEGLFGNPEVIYPYSNTFGTFLSADVDFDGDIDVVSNVGGLEWHENLGGGAFINHILNLNSDETGINFANGEFSLEDIDGDGDIDILTKNRVDDIIFWTENLTGSGCTDPSACNYDPQMWIEDGSCCFTDCGCTNPLADNFLPSASCDDGSCRFLVVGRVFFDENENGLLDSGESGLPFQEVTLLPAGLELTTNNSGNFLVNASGNDEFTFAIEVNPLFPFFTTPQSMTFHTTQENWNQDTLYFGVSNELPAFDLEADLYPLIGGFPCDDERAYYLCFRNTSNVPIDVQLEFHYDSLFQEITESTLIDSLGENVAYLSFTDIAPLELVCAEVELLSPTVEFLGEFLETSLEVRAFYEGEEVAFGTDSLSEELLCAYDPNDKQVFPSGYSEEHYIANDTTLEYLIRFQNTGNAPATDVILRDTLDENLDITTFQLRVHSHSVFTSVDPASREVEFYFQNIMLADSVNNEPESHGLVSFTIQPDAELPLLTELNNTAAIYFDNNPPIITNTTWSTIYDCSLFDVSFTDDGALLTASEGDHYQWLLDGEPIEGATEQEFTALMDGNYSVQVSNDFPCADNSGTTFISVTSISEWQGREVTLFPNPMTTTAILDLGDLRGRTQLEIYDIAGTLQRSEILSLESGTLTLERGTLSKGIYILRLTVDSEAVELKFLVE